MPDKEINRQVKFIHTQAYDSEDVSGANNSWVYFRPPEGYLFQLIKIDVSIAQAASLFQGVTAIFDGHEYTHWNIWPGVESYELLGRIETNIYILNGTVDLHNWKCKEFTIGIRSLSGTYGYKVCCIIYYYLKKASREELLEYALKHPIRQDTFKRAMRGTTVEPGEA